ncbi:TIGR04222 domain-containing membrane protein [Sphingomicrobium arenosum]|uniref:TIGR04222 domain-containing membrane protein n=1 Tax=Sphingomicrobium arenosum TaxID=2233861 RepID=UPI00223FB089|nr:TIGR04222 domain-containing membrane protein [Sphingomicrobium arenosum]
MDMSAYSATQFLWLYFGLLLLVFALSYLIPAWLRGDGEMAGELDAPMLAYLAKGRERYVEAQLADLFASQKLTLGDMHFMVANRGAGMDPAQQAVLRQTGLLTYPDLFKSLATHADEMRGRLERRGLLVHGGELLQLRLFTFLPFVLLIAFGAVRLEAGQRLGEPIGLLAVLMGTAFVIGLFRTIGIDRRTRSAMEALGSARNANDRLRRAPQQDEVMLAVALFGTTALVASPWESLHSLRQAQSGDGSSGCGNSGGGDGGCGGCGGCG